MSVGTQYTRTNSIFTISIDRDEIQMNKYDYIQWVFSVVISYGKQIYKTFNEYVSRNATRGHIKETQMLYTQSYDFD